MKQNELAAELETLKTQSGKIAKEQSDRFDALTAKVTELEEALKEAADGDLAPEVVEALNGLKAAQQSLDDAIPDAPATA